MLRPVYIVSTSIKACRTRNPEMLRSCRCPVLQLISASMDALQRGIRRQAQSPSSAPICARRFSRVAVEAYPAWRRRVSGAPHCQACTRVRRHSSAGSGELRRQPSATPRRRKAMWKKRPHGQLAKVAEAQASHCAMPFPDVSAAGYQRWRRCRGQDGCGRLVGSDHRCRQALRGQTSHQRRGADAAPALCRGRHTARAPQGWIPTPYEADPAQNRFYRVRSRSMRQSRARRTRRDGSGTCWPSWPRRNRGLMSSQLVRRPQIGPCCAGSRHPLS